MCYLDTFEGTPSYSMPVVMRSVDWDHWGVACGLYMGWTTLARANMVYRSEGPAVYVAMESDVVKAGEYDASDGGRKATYSEVLFYQMDVGAGYGYLLVDLHNPGNKYDNFGQSGEDGEPIKLLSQGEIGFPVNVKVNAVSEKAKQKVEAAGGSVEILPYTVNKRLPRS